MLIRNNKKDFNPTDKPFIEVADSWDLSSQLSRQSEWQFRIYAQMISTQDKKNWYFFTLTYAEKYLPTHTYDGVTCPCFSRDCIHRFCRGIQMDMLKHHKVTDIDYLIASEFGSDQYSARPHHHGVLGVDKSVTPDIVHTLIKKHWSVLTGEYFCNGLPKRDPLGYVYPRLWYGGYDKKGHFHNPVMLDPTRYDSAAIYTSKYCCKQIGFFKNPKVKCLMRHLMEKGNDADKHEWNRVKPFIYVSKHFGEIICEWVEGNGVPFPVKVDKDPFVNIVSAAVELGYMNIPEGVLVDVSEIKKYPPEKLTVISTGSQGEPMSALYRMAFNMHDKIELGTDDVVIISASAIPGNEKLVGNIINELYKKGVRVLNDSVAEVHVSGHACQEELKIIHALTKPQYFMPVHGEARHLYHHKELAEYMGMEPNHIFISEVGKILEIGTDGAKFNGTVPSGIVLVDGTGVGDVGNVVLRDRRHLSEDGIIIVVATIDTQASDIISGPEIVSRGFVYAKESEPLIEQIRMISREALYHCLDKGVRDWAQLKYKMKEDLSKFIYSQTKRKPMILPIIMDI